MNGVGFLILRECANMFLCIADIGHDQRRQMKGSQNDLQET